MLYLSLSLFFIIAATNLYMQTESGPSQKKIKHISKALLMPALFFILWIGGFDLSLGIALLFSTLGDIFLIGQSNRHFLLGLISFLFAHIGYCVYFYTSLNTHQLSPLLIFGLAMVIGWYAIILYKAISPKGLIRVGMPIYMLVIGGMILLAALNWQQKTDLASSLMLLGALLFGSSDSVLAFRRIKGVKSLPESYVMFSYISGQFLIILGHLLSL